MVKDPLLHSETNIPTFNERNRTIVYSELGKKNVTLTKNNPEMKTKVFSPRLNYFKIFISFYRCICTNTHRHTCTHTHTRAETSQAFKLALSNATPWPYNSHKVHCSDPDDNH